MRCGRAAQGPRSDLFFEDLRSDLRPFVAELADAESPQRVRQAYGTAGPLFEELFNIPTVNAATHACNAGIACLQRSNLQRRPATAHPRPVAVDVESVLLESVRCTDGRPDVA